MAKCSPEKLEKLAGIIKRQGRLHMYDAVSFLRIGPKHFKYEVLNYFLYQYGEFIEFNEPFLIAREPEKITTAPSPEQASVVAPAQAVQQAAPVVQGGP